MELQTKEQKKAEVAFRKKALEQRLGIKTFDSSYKFGEKEFYVTNWVKPQLTKFQEVIHKIGSERFNGALTLEIGAESGHLSVYLENHYSTKRTIVSDIADSLIEACSSIVAWLQYKRCPKIVILDNYALPFKDKSFDFVFGVSVLHHFPNPYPILKEARRVIKDNGIAVFIGEPFLPSYLLFMQLFYSVFDKKQGICEKVFSLNEWLFCIRDFKIKHMQFEMPNFLKKILPNLPFICKYLTGGGLSFVLEK